MGINDSKLIIYLFNLYTVRRREHQQTGEGGHTGDHGSSLAEAASHEALSAIAQSTRQRARFGCRKSMAIGIWTLRRGSLQISIWLAGRNSGKTRQTFSQWPATTPRLEFTSNSQNFFLPFFFSFHCDKQRIIL